MVEIFLISHLYICGNFFLVSEILLNLADVLGGVKEFKRMVFFFPICCGDFTGFLNYAVYSQEAIEWESVTFQTVFHKDVGVCIYHGEYYGVHLALWTYPLSLLPFTS